MRYLQRTAIMSDPNWKNGFYYEKAYPLNGIKLARYNRFNKKKTRYMLKFI